MTIVEITSTKQLPPRFILFDNPKEAEKMGGTIYAWTRERPKRYTEYFVEVEE